MSSGHSRKRSPQAYQLIFALGPDASRPNSAVLRAEQRADPARRPRSGRRGGRSRGRPHDHRVGERLRRHGARRRFPARRRRGPRVRLRHRGAHARAHALSPRAADPCAPRPTRAGGCRPAVAGRTHRARASCERLHIEPPTSNPRSSNGRSSASASSRAAASAFETACATVRAPGMTVVTPGRDATQASDAAGSETPSGRAAASSRAASMPILEVDPRERLAAVERLAVAVVAAVVVSRERRVCGVAAGEEPGRERDAGEDADSGGLCGRQHLVERLEPERIQDDLDARDPRPRDGRQCLSAGLDRDAVGGDRPVRDEGVERVVGRVGLDDLAGRAVQLHEVEGVDSEVGAGAVGPQRGSSPPCSSRAAAPRAGPSSWRRRLRRRARSARNPPISFSERPSP